MPIAEKEEGDSGERVDLVPLKIIEWNLFIAQSHSHFGILRHTLTLFSYGLVGLIG